MSHRKINVLACGVLIALCRLTWADVHNDSVFPGAKIYNPVTGEWKSLPETTADLDLGRWELWISRNDYNIGWMYVDRGSELTTPRTVIAPGFNSYGSIWVKDPGSFLSTPDMRIGGPGANQGALTLTDGGAASIGELHMEPASRLYFTVGDHSRSVFMQNPILEITQHADFSAMVDPIPIVLERDYIPHERHTFELIAYNSIELGPWSLDPSSPDFLFDLGSLPSEFDWTITGDGESIILEVPEPATALLTLGALATIRRRSRTA